ncbi:MAG: peptide chain release factor 2 [Candidatus Kerfeldbacteria bacterium]|nr:peptide chain release factor 2 [Candidatus Kerfeldbacteria bacterium]
MTGLPRREGYFDLDQKRQLIAELEEAMNAPEFWSDRKTAEAKSRELKRLKDEVEGWQTTEQEVGSWMELAAMAEETQRAEVESHVRQLEERYRQLEFTLLLNATHDQSNAIISVHAGTGGTDAMDWAEMLARMLLRFCEQRGWKTKILDESKGGEAGIKSMTFEVTGEYAYGYLKSESGVHRLVRISPFDAEKMRHTSFALVEVIPELDDVQEVVIDPKDLRIDTFLSSGHGGQSVQTTYSAVRVVHLPTKIMVSVQNERSQTQNKETAMKILKAKLHQLNLDKLAREKSELRGEYHEAAWGNQIRSYVLQPYRLVKDHRTKQETSQVEDVLGGDLLAFMDAYLRWNKAGRPRVESQDDTL